MLSNVARNKGSLPSGSTQLNMAEIHILSLRLLGGTHSNDLNFGNQLAQATNK